MHASEGLARLEVAIATGKKATDEAVAMFQGGTLPPPPWPSPELADALDRADELRERLAALVRGGDPDFDPAQPNVGRVVKEVERRAVLVETLAAKLSKRREVVATRTPERIISDVKKAFGIPTGVLIAAAVIWMLKDE